MFASSPLDLSKVMLIPVKETDLPLLLAWRQNPIVMAHFVDGFESWERHLTWFYGLRREIKESFLIILDQRPVGEVHLNFEPGPIAVGIYIGDVTLWGKGVGSRAIEGVLAMLRERGYRGGVTAGVHPRNRRSQRMFEKVGFQFRTLKEDGYFEYSKDLSTSL